MARGVNKVILIGNLGNDPDTKYTQGGMAITTVSLATSSVRKDRDGNTQERTEWHRVKFFGKIGEIAGEYLRKGRQIYIEGSLRYVRHTGRDGQERYYTEIVAEVLQLLGSPDRGGDRDTGRRAPPPSREPPAVASARQALDDFADDDIRSNRMRQLTADKLRRATGTSADEITCLYILPART